MLLYEELLIACRRLLCEPECRMHCNVVSALLDPKVSATIDTHVNFLSEPIDT